MFFLSKTKIKVFNGITTWKLAETPGSACMSQTVDDLGPNPRRRTSLDWKSCYFHLLPKPLTPHFSHGSFPGSHCTDTVLNEQPRSDWCKKVKHAFQRRDRRATRYRSPRFTRAKDLFVMQTLTFVCVGHAAVLKMEIFALVGCRCVRWHPHLSTNLPPADAGDASCCVFSERHKHRPLTGFVINDPFFKLFFTYKPHWTIRHIRQNKTVGQFTHLNFN